MTATHWGRVLDGHRYHNEAGVGRAIRASGLAHGDIFVTTKVPCCPSEIFCTKYDPPVLSHCHEGLPAANYTENLGL